MNFQTIHSEGSLITADLLAQIQTGEAGGQKSSDFGLHGKIRLIDEIAACWSDAKAYWEAFQHGLGRIKEGETGATQTREQWILPLFRTLGFDKITFTKSAAQAGGQTYAISHRLGGGDEGLPIHIEGANINIDTRPPTGRPRISPHALVQEYLNRTEHLWGIVTNGYQLRLLRDSERLSRPTYLEFDLKQIMEGEHFAEFQVFYRLVHRSRWPRDMESAHECLLEQYYQQGIEAGGRVRERLRDGVENALKIFGNGFLNHPDNSELRQHILGNKIDAFTYYQQLLRLIYRFLFLMVSEERNLVGPDPKDDHLCRIYETYYSITRLREKVERPVDPEERYWDLWEGVKQNFRLYCHSSLASKLGVTALNGDLFGSKAMPDLENAFLYNRDFLHGFAHLSIFKDEKTHRRINYAYLDVEELGSVYESLLDYHPVITPLDPNFDKGGQVGIFKFELAFGTERKSTGSYYTRHELVQELIKSALVPVIEERLKNAKTKEEKERTLLSLKVCDISTGSGHFLLAAARRIGKELAKVRSGEEEPTPTEFRKAVRDVIQHCIYGVDLNPLAVDLCKVALWLEGHNKGYPLTFLDHRIKCGNSLIGLDKLERLKDGIPDDAFKPVTGDDKEVAKQIKAINRKERRDRESGQTRLPYDIKGSLDADLKSFAEQARNVDAIDDNSPEDVEQKQKRYQQIRTDEKWWKDWTAANIWTAAFFYPLTRLDDPAIPTHERLMRYIESPKAAHGQLVGKANALAAKHRFFHWGLEFPEVIEAGGFDCVLGNPPWERIKLEEQQFFTYCDSEIANAPNKSTRLKLIAKLKDKNPELLLKFIEAKHYAESDSRFIRESLRFPFTALGDINTYALFAELSFNLINAKGQIGIIVPTGIATDNTTKDFFASIINKFSLAKLVDFQNSENLFPAVDSNQRFCLLTLSGYHIDQPIFSFFISNVSKLNDPARQFSMPIHEIALFNPNTNTCPSFRTRMDMEIARKIYKHCPIIENEKNKANPWNIKLTAMFHMSNDSQLFASEPDEDFVPLYEAKMFHYFNHRFANAGEPRGEMRIRGSSEKIDKDQLSDPAIFATPRYYVSKVEVEKRLNDYKKKWFIALRDITGVVSNERTAIFTVLPRLGVGNNATLVLVEIGEVRLISCLLGNFCSICFDFLARQKVGGLHMNFFIVKQLPVLPPENYSQEDIKFILIRVLELVYTAHDMKPFALDMGYDGSPFKWDEERRAILRAELDAYYAKLYGLTRDELRYILDPQDVYGPDFPGETFRVLKEKEIRKYGEYRTRRLVLAAWDRLFGKANG